MRKSNQDGLSANLAHEKFIISEARQHTLSIQTKNKSKPYELNSYGSLLPPVVEFLSYLIKPIQPEGL